VSGVPLPELVRIAVAFERPVLNDAARAVCDEFEGLGIVSSLAGARVGITVGSRGIRDIIPILRALAAKVRSCGGAPVLLAAMGSHGGGSESGQAAVLDGLGVTEEAIGAPVILSAKSVKIGENRMGRDVHVLESALSVDAILAVNRVKVHTAFHGEIESGLFKMLVVGLGGPTGASGFHSAGSGLPDALKDSGSLILKKLPVVAGFAIVENGYEETALVKGVAPERMFEDEREILNYARSLMPRLPVADLDALIVEEIGKNYSGTGLDTNIIGRLRIEGASEPESPSIKRIAALGLSKESHGNANGVGLVDIVTKKLVDEIDKRATFLNCVTTGFLMRGATPVHFDTEREVAEALLTSLGSKPAREIRLMQISDTLHLSESLASTALLEELRDRSDIRIIGPASPMSFTEDGRLQKSIRWDRSR
jgi:hypothetical protein